MGTHSCCRSIHFIHPGHRLAQIARSRIQTVYFPERNYLMLPSSLSEKIFSLGIDAGTRRNHVMTFSARMRYDASFQCRSHIVEKLTWKINSNVPDKLPYGTTIYHISKEFGWVV